MMIPILFTETATTVTLTARVGQREYAAGVETIALDTTRDKWTALRFLMSNIKTDFPDATLRRPCHIEI